jgi:hypothetical protein
MSEEVMEVPAVEVEPAKEAPKPEAEIRAQDAEQPELPLAAEPEVAAVEPEPAKESETTPQEQDWRDKEIRRKHAQIQEEKRRRTELEKEIEDLRVLAQRPADGSAPTPVQSMSQADVQRAAQALREQEKYQDKLINTNAAGEKNYGQDWTKALETLSTLGTVEQETMRGILATKDPAKVLYSLGKNPAEYQRIMDIADPYQRQAEFVELSLKQAAPKPSNAPAPVEPLRARVNPTVTLSDKDSDEDWYAKRKAQRDAKFAKRA